MNGLSSPMAALVGLLAGVVREVIPEKEDVWHFGPFLFLNIPQWIWSLLRDRKGNWAMLPLFTLRRVRGGLDRAGQYCSIALAFPDSARQTGAIWRWVVLSSVMCVAMAIKSWNNNTH